MELNKLLKRIKELEEENKLLHKTNEHQSAQISSLLKDLKTMEKALSQLIVFAGIYETNAHYDNIHSNLEVSLTDIATNLKAQDAILFQRQDDDDFRITNSSIKYKSNNPHHKDENMLRFFQSCSIKHDFPELFDKLESTSYDSPKIISLDNLSRIPICYENGIEAITFIKIIINKKVKYLLSIINPKYELDHSLLDLIATAYANTLSRIEKENLTHNLSITDNMTGVYNRRYYNLIKESIQNKGVSSIGVIMADLFRLKHVNDTLGHEAGDIYIKEMVKLLIKYFKNDMIFRLGGDEFIIIVVDKDYRYIDEKLTALYDDIANLSLVDSYNNPIFARIDTGVEYAYGDFDFNMMVRNADLQMNENKNRYYRENGIDRRK